MKNNTLEINVLSDIHYYAEGTGISGKAYERALMKSQKLLKGSAAVLADCFDRLARDEGTDIVLISGDLTNNGETQSHAEVTELFRSLKARGKRVYAITATHDYKKDGFAPGYDGDRAVRVPALKREQLFELYREFGPDEAIAVHEKSMSYIVQLADGYRLFALNDDSNLDGASGFSDECFDWITRQVEAAKRDGQFIIAMTHHPIIAPSPFYAAVGKGDMMGGWQYRREQLADMGVNFMLTGHTHIQNISYIFSKKGNVFFDISAASPIGYPGTYRKIVCDRDSNTLSVDTVEFARESLLNLDGEPLLAALDRQLCGMIRAVVDAAATDRRKFASMATAFSVPEKKGLKIGLAIKPAAKLLNRLTVGRIARCVRKRAGLSAGEYAEISSDRVVDFIASLVMHLFEGDSPYPPETAYYRVTVAVLDRLDSVLRFFRFNIDRVIKGAGSVRELVEPLLYNNGICDKKAELNLNAKNDSEVQA